MQKKLKIAVQIIGIVAIGSASILLASLVSNPKENNPVSINCPLDTSSYQVTKSKHDLVLSPDGWYSYASVSGDGGFAGNKKVNIKISGSSQIVCGYLHYVIDINNAPLENTNLVTLVMGAVDTYWGLQFGGHIYPQDKSSIISNSATSTDIIIPLNSISYDGTADTNIQVVDWVSLLNVSNKINFGIALNTTSKTGRIDSVDIAYKCWNPQTGKETDDCSLSK